MAALFNNIPWPKIFPCIWAMGGILFFKKGQFDIDIFQEFNYTKWECQIQALNLGINHLIVHHHFVLRKQKYAHAWMSLVLMVLPKREIFVRKAKMIWFYEMTWFYECSYMSWRRPWNKCSHSLQVARREFSVSLASSDSCWLLFCATSQFVLQEPCPILWKMTEIHVCQWLTGNVSRKENPKAKENSCAACYVQRKTAQSGVVNVDWMAESWKEYHLAKDRCRV